MPVDHRLHDAITNGQPITDLLDLWYVRYKKEYPVEVALRFGRREQVLEILFHAQNNPGEHYARYNPMMDSLDRRILSSDAAEVYLDLAQQGFNIKHIEQCILAFRAIKCMKIRPIIPSVDDLMRFARSYDHETEDLEIYNFYKANPAYIGINAELLVWMIKARPDDLQFWVSHASDKFKLIVALVECKELETARLVYNLS